MQKQKVLFEVEAFSKHVNNIIPIFVVEDPNDANRVYFSFDKKTGICGHMSDKQDFLHRFQNTKSKFFCKHKDCKVDHNVKFKLIGNYVSGLPRDMKDKFVETLMRNGYEIATRSIVSGFVKASDIIDLFTKWSNQKIVPDLVDNLVFFDANSNQTIRQFADNDKFAYSADRIHYDIMDFTGYMIDVACQHHMVTIRLETKDHFANLLTFLADFTKYLVTLNPLDYFMPGKKYDFSSMMERLLSQLIRLYCQIFELTSTENSKIFIVVSSDKPEYFHCQVLRGAGSQYLSWVETAISNVLMCFQGLKFVRANVLVFLAQPFIRDSGDFCVPRFTKDHLGMYPIRIGSNELEFDSLQDATNPPEDIIRPGSLFLDPCSIPPLIRLFDKYLKIEKNPKISFFANQRHAKIIMSWFKSLFYMVEHNLPINASINSPYDVFRCNYSKKTKSDFHALMLQFEETFNFYSYENEKDYYFEASTDFFYNECKRHFFSKSPKSKQNFQSNFEYEKIKEKTRNTFSQLKSVSIKLCPAPTNLAIIQRSLPKEQNLNEYSESESEDQDSDEESDSEEFEDKDSDEESDSESESDSEDGSREEQKKKKQKLRYKLFSKK
jgi:hypothetical protein